MSSAGTSDYDMSEYSNSPSSYVKSPSPFGSPSQQVPQLVTDLTGLSCNDTFLDNFGEGPRLVITEQPQNHFRFRYVSEMVGTHGCLLGQSTNTQNGKTKTHPTVELLNYSGRARIRCSLAQHNNEHEHPHKLLEDEKDRDVSYDVPENGSYRVGFAGMGIIHTAKKVVPGLLFKKFSEHLKNSNMGTNLKELRAQCEHLAKNIELNIVRLKFSAHDINTGKEICPPVFSEPIHNMKSAATNDLKICRISRYTGRPRGGDDVFIFVEKVNKKNIMIRFYELDADGKEVWSDNGRFMLSDVHHQYGIVFSTPPYKDPKTPVDVKVFIELVRPTDGRTSEPKEFTYKAEQVYRQIKKRKNNSYSSLDSSSSGSITNLLPTTMNFTNQNDIKRETEIPIVTLPQAQSPVMQPSTSTQCGLGSALGTISQTTLQPMWSGAAHIENNTSIPNLILNSTELDEITNLDASTDNMQYTADELSKYFSFFGSTPSDIQSEEPNAMGFIRLIPDSALIKNFAQSTLVADSGRPIKEEPCSSKSSEQVGSTASSISSNMSSISSMQESAESLEYSAVFKPEDGLEVKKLVKELCEIIKNKKAYKNQDVRSKLERLFDIRLSNGDTFLHMTLFSNLQSFQSIVKVIHQVKMSHLLNYTNNKQQTILHLAVLYRSPSLVSFLVSKGCNPMLKDSEEDNAIHYALKYNELCLQPLMDAIKQHNIRIDYNDYNCDKQTSLHVAASSGSVASVRALLCGGWSTLSRDAAGRTPLHLAARDARPLVLHELLQHVPQSEVDEVDGSGNTALQIVCGSTFNQHSVEMVKLLLEHKANPSKHEDSKQSAWNLAADKPLIREVMKDYMYNLTMEEDVKSEPEDEYESADEDMNEIGLSGLSLYIHEVSTIVDMQDAWRPLADKLQMTPLVEWFAAQPSPTYTMLMQVKETSEDMTSKSLALILEDMGLIEAATIVRRAIE